jgi:hypothetical protein
MTSCISHLGTKIEFQLEKSREEFYLMVGKTNEAVPATDNEKYIFLINDCCLYVQTGTLNVVLYQEIERRWPKEDIIYFFRRFDMLELNLGKGSAGLFSETLWSESINPLRIYFFLVSYESFTPGAYSKNPVI